MKTLTKILIGAAALATVAGGAAWARGPGGGCVALDGPGFMGPGAMMVGGPAGMGPAARHPMLERMFDRLDADKSGAVTLDEAIAAVDAHFAKIDANGDGVLDKAEIESWVGRRVAPKAVEHFLAVHDLDGDGKVAKAEFEKPARKLFALFDRNDDGKVTRDELAKAGPMGMMGGPMGGPMAGPIGKMHRGMPWPGGPGGWMMPMAPDASPDAPVPTPAPAPAPTPSK